MKEEKENLSEKQKSIEILKKREIKSSYFIFFSILFIINTLMLLHVISSFPFHRIFTHETIWSYILSSLYLFCIYFSDINLFLFNSTKLEDFNSYIRNSYSIISYSYCYSITIEFWLILFFGLAFGKNPFTENNEISFKMFLEALYLHLGITIIMIIDLIFTKRKIILKNHKILFKINLIFFCYSIVVLISNYIFLMPAYPFMKNAGIGLMIFIFIISFALINICYYIHLFLVNKINKEKIIDN